jgi:hypothetical protein
VDPLWYRADWTLRLTCGCGRSAVEQRLGAFAQERGLHRETRLYCLFGRLRCRDCGARPSAELMDRRL